MSGEELRARAQALVDAIEAKDEANIHGWSVALRAALAAPSTPEPSGLRIVGCPHCAEDFAVENDCCYGPSGHDEREPHHVALRAAPSTEPALDADTLVVAMLEAVKGVALRHGINPTEFLDAANAAANAVRRLAEPQPSEETR